MSETIPVQQLLTERGVAALERLADAQERIAAATEEGQRQAKAAMDTMTAANAAMQATLSEPPYSGLPGLRKR